jgi:hypothetical protein
MDDLALNLQLSGQHKQLGLKDIFALFLKSFRPDDQVGKTGFILNCWVSLFHRTKLTGWAFSESSASLSRGMDDRTPASTKLLIFHRHAFLFVPFWFKYLIGYPHPHTYTTISQS